MNISMSMLESYLSRYDTESNIQNDALTIRGIRFLSEGRRRSSREYVYIGQAIDFLKDEAYAGALMLANGKNHIICRGADYEELLNEVLSAFDFYNHIDESGSLGALSIGGYFVDESGALQHDLTDEARATYGPDGEMAMSRYLSLEGERVGFVMCFPLSETSTQLAVCISTR